MYDLCVIGGGAAGMSCAIAAGCNGKKVLLIDKNKKLGKKLYATGNGKCNLSNLKFDTSKHFNSNSDNYTKFLNSVFNNAYNDYSWPYKQLIDYMDYLGIYVINKQNYIYPSSTQASSVVWAMIDELKRTNVKIASNQEVISIEGKYPSFSIKCENETYTASRVVLANGGASYKALGGSKSGYQLAKSLGHTIHPIRPCLCGINVEEDITLLAGLRADVRILLIDDYDNIIQESEGEIQITNQGLSGICIFEISSKAGKLLEKGITPKVRVSFFNPHKNSAYNRLKDKINIGYFDDRTIIGAFNGYLNDKLAVYACTVNEIDGKQRATDTSKTDLINILNTLNCMEFNVTSLYDLEQAQLTAGGVDIDEINPANMESKLVKGLYIVGELLDIDGICGGYNLTFAMLSGYKAGKSI